MDPSFTHSGADVEAFTAALNRDISVDMSAPTIAQQPNPPGASLATDSNSTPNQLIDDWHASSKEDDAVHQSLQQEEQTGIDAQEQQPSQVELIKHPESAETRKTYCSVRKSFTDPQHLQKDHPVEKISVSNSQESSVHQSQQDKLKHPESQQQGLTQQLNEQQASTSDQTSNQMKRMKSGSVPFTMLIPILRPHLDKDRNMQLDAVFAKLRSNEITKEHFLRVIRNIVGDPMLRQAAQKVQAQMAGRSSQISSTQSELQASQQQASRGTQQVVEGQSVSQLHSISSQQQRSQTSASVQQYVEGQSVLQLQHISPVSLQKPVKSNVDNQSILLGHPPAQVPSTGVSVLKQEREVSLVSVQAVNKQQLSQHSPSSLPMYGATVTNFNSQILPRPAGTSSVVSRKSQIQDSQMRQLTPQGILSMHPGSSQPANIMNTSKYDVQSAVTESSRHGGTVSHFTSHISAQQSQPSRQSSTSKEQKANPLSTTPFVKQEVAEQAIELESRPQISPLQGSFGTRHVDQGNAAPSSSKVEAVEKQTSRVTFSASTSTVTTNQMPGSMTSPLESVMQGRSQIPSATPPVATGVSARTPPKKTSVGQKKPLDTQSTPSPASKKQKVSGAYHDQSIEQLNDVTAVSGVNLREEEEQLLSAPKEESRASEATRRVVREEEEKLILQKGPFIKKSVLISVLVAVSKCGIKNISTDVERCLSLGVEERLRGLISNMIRLSRQRVDIEKARHQIVVTSDVRRQILMMSKKAKEEWERKQAEEAEKLRKQNVGEGNGGSEADREKDEAGRSKSLKSKEEDDKMRATAANVAARAAVGGDDMLSKWQLMAEQARQKREGGVEAVSAGVPGRATTAAAAARKPLLSSSRTSKEQQEGEKKTPLRSPATGGMRKFGRMVPHPKVIRSISTKDVIAVLEREPQMTKSSLIFRLYDGAPASSPSD
ncbi:unnamed protein product [Spirodela intermedia]|uniref:RST domain-containing protein n=1 Tax=Spirodela intermedia TaxID=51605 RepID=A0A7I8JA05_SPIIN|nr:unnamed protein product [Spirodela intermedia]CAA6666273.1 unnamed protein product [Spirodela intermedia]